MKKISSLIRFLNKEGLFSAALNIRRLAAVEIDPHSQSRIQSAAVARSNPFLSWFPEGQRVYLPFERQLDRGAYAEENFKYLISYMNDYGHRWSGEDTFSGRRGNEKLNAKWVKKNIIIPYAQEEYDSGNLDYFSLFDNSVVFKKYLLNLFNKFLSNTYNFNLTLDDYLKEWQINLDLKDSSMENVTKINDAKNKVKKITETIKDIYEELDNFFGDPMRIASKEALSVVITIKPEDIATMSTGRRWTSCMELNKGQHYEDVFCEISDGGFVAYLIKADDKDIDNPLARLSVRRFDSADGRSIAIPEGDIYSSGEEYPELTNIVKRWIKEKQGDIHPALYKRKGGSWSDTFDKEETFGVDLEVGPKRILEIMRDPADFFLKNYDFKDTWTVTDNFYNAWTWWFEVDDEDDGSSWLDEYGYPEGKPAPLSFLHLEEPKQFSSREAAEKWIEDNSLDKDTLKANIEMSLDNWRWSEEQKPWAEGVDISDLNEMKVWVDNNERYTINKADAMSKASDVGKRFVDSQNRKIMSNLIGKGEFYNHMLENKDDLLYFYELNSKSESSKKQFAELFPDTFEYEPKDEREIDYFSLSKSFENIKDDSLKQERANKLRDLLDNVINYNDIISPIIREINSNTSIRYRPKELYFDTLIRALHNSGATVFRSDFTTKLKEILDKTIDDPRLSKMGYRAEGVRDKVEEIIFGIMNSYRAHDPAALRIYLDKVNGLADSFEKNDSDIETILDISYKVDEVKKLARSLDHLQESGSILIPGLERLYFICRSIYEDRYDFSNLSQTSADNNMKNIVKKKSAQAMNSIANLVSKINKAN